MLWFRAGASGASKYRWNGLGTAKAALLPAFIVGLIAGGMEFAQFLLGFGTTTASDALKGATGTLSNATLQVAQNASQSVPAGSAESFTLGLMAFTATLVVVTFWAILAAALGAKTSKTN
ncbi:Uncharacterised protein [uncultured archaeon]|nr:Uncharacterised protein [uncultured archaeon]